MKTCFLTAPLAVLLAALATTAPLSARAKLAPGDPAPKLQTGQWVQGEPVKGFDSNHVYIVEFWATWCGPCRATIPHVNELSEKLKDKGLIVIGQNVWEQDDSQVAPFVKQMGSKMTYRVALDDKSLDPTGAMAKNWMEAAGQDGIPAAFVINRQGRIAWLGHPAELDEPLLEQILAGTFDIAAYTKEQQKAQETQAHLQTLMRTFENTMQKKDWAAAEPALNELEKAAPAEMSYRLETARVAILLGQTNYAAACKLAETLSNEHPQDGQAQNALAWSLASTPGVDHNGLLLGEKIAERANAATDSNQPPVLDTLARLQFLLGKKDLAIANQQKAVDGVNNAALKAHLNTTLDSYKTGKLPAAQED